jgi:perosamine synthetase
MIPYARQSIDEKDIAAIAEVLRSDWLTTGPKVEEFEQRFAEFVGSRESVAVSSGTAALHAAVHAIGIKPGDEVIVPAITFAASANCVVYEGGTPVFADVEPDTLLIDCRDVERRITPRTRAILAVDYAGQPCDYDALQALADRHQLTLLADACHSAGGRYKGRMVGTLAMLSAFSFHPVKPITTGEGGMIVTDDPVFAQRMRMFRNHGIGSDHRQREKQGSWFYEMVELGYNYRLSDIQSALGISQLKKLPGWVRRRREISSRYAVAFREMRGVKPLAVRPDRESGWHLYVVCLETGLFRGGRAEVFRALRADGIGVNVHYIPVPWHPYYQRRGYLKGQWPVAESVYEQLISLPLFPAMSDQDVENVIAAVRRATEEGT